MIEFSITEDSDQQFSTIIGGRRVTLRLWYANFNDRWSADVSIDNEPVLHGQRVMGGVDMLSAYDFGIGAIFMISEQGFEPGRDALPNGTVRLYHATQEEVDAAISA